MVKNTRFYFIGILSLLLLFAGCLPKQQLPQRNKPVVRPVERSESRTSAGSGVSAVGLAYIERYRDISIEEMNKYGIPASIKLAQGLLESGNGTSRLAVEGRNHFGIKCAGEWLGDRMYHDDDEQGECFRVYQNPEDSFRDHSLFLLRKRYEPLFKLDRRDYKAWAAGLKSAGYATNPRYAELLVDLIERYQLYQFDGAVSAGQVTRSAQNVQTPASTPVSPVNSGTTVTSVETSSASVSTNRSSTDQKQTAMKIHEVRAGETANMVAEKYGVTVQQLQTWNQLKNLDLQPGQLLVVSR